jgi:hypothetical protein
MKKSIFFFACLACLFHLTGKAQIFVSPSGSDTNDGSFAHPYLTIPKAVTAVPPGDTIYLRGGVYTITSTIQFYASKSGNDTMMYCLFAWPGDSVRPLLDCSGMAYASSNRGIYMKASYWHFKGFDVKGAGDNGMLMQGAHNIIEFCSFFENQDTGLQIGGGGSYNQIINCDSYFNRDPSQGNADGFAPKLDVGTGNSFYGCRSWQNSDDGWDGYMRPSDSVDTRLENCWSFMNGYLKDGSAGIGNGNGFKMGGGDNTNADSLRHNMTLINCLAFDNRVKGFDQNNNRGSMTLFNCTGYRNGANNFNISGPIRSTSTLTVKNCIALGGKVSLAYFAVQATNTWLAPFSVSNADFVSIDTTGVRGPRKLDGSLPDVPFMHLIQGSALIDAGTDIGLPYHGAEPDLGCFETDYTTGVKDEPVIPGSFYLGKSWPNPFNPTTNLSFVIGHSSFVTIRIFDILGRQVGELVNGVMEAGSHTVTWDASGRSAGVYFYRLEARETANPSHVFTAVGSSTLIK